MRWVVHPYMQTRLSCVPLSLDLNLPCQYLEMASTPLLKDLVPILPVTETITSGSRSSQLDSILRFAMLKRGLQSNTWKDLCKYQYSLCVKVVSADVSPAVYRYRPDTVMYERDRTRVYDDRYTADQPMTIIRERPPPQSGDAGPTFVRTVPAREIISLD